MVRSSSSSSSTSSWNAQSMSLEDCIGQMAQMDISKFLTPVADDDDNRKQLKQLDLSVVEEWIGKRGVGSVLNSAGSDAHWTAREYRHAWMQLNRVARQHNRPPVIWGIDSVHGANYLQGSVLAPQPLNTAATWNLTVSRQAGYLASRDSRLAGLQWIFSPLLGLALEPRWSRVYETFGEDPLLVGFMAQAMIQGIQQGDHPDEANNNTLFYPQRAAACAKHFLGYSMPRTGHDRSPSWIPTRHLAQYFIPPWQRVLKDQDDEMSIPWTVMESYVETDGVPNVANPQALQYWLRYRLGFDGVLVTDYDEVHNLVNWHAVVETTGDAVAHALQEGSIDVSMIPHETWWDDVQNAIQNDGGTVDEQRIRQSAQRVLDLKQERLQMRYEDIFAGGDDDNDDDDTLPWDLIGSTADQERALHMIHQSLILVQNDNQALPLFHNDEKGSAAAAHKVLVTGPTADSLSYQSGGWTGDWQGVSSEAADSWFTYGSTVLQALQDPDAETQMQVTYRCGVDILGRECDDGDIDTSLLDQFKQDVGLEGTDSVARAVQAAADVKVVIVCVGEENYAEKPGDLRSLALPQGQVELVQALRDHANKNVKIVLVYFGGRPRLLQSMVENVDAVVLAFLPGPDAGKGIRDLLTGRINPSGRLPITYPKFEDGGGIPYFHAVSDQCTEDNGDTMPHWGYVSPCPVQWPFGHGLSYTTFGYNGLSAEGGLVSDMKVQVTVQNTGPRAGAETVMWFTQDLFRSTTPEYKRLRAFEKVWLEPGEALTLHHTIPLSELRFIGPHDDFTSILEPDRKIWVGVGADTDCRKDGNSNSRCVLIEPTTSAADKTTGSGGYVAACEAACALWSNSNCSATFGLTEKSCNSMCTSMPRLVADGMQLGSADGWGWNYVHCLESVVWGMQLERKRAAQMDDAAAAVPYNQTAQCWKMTRLCRDVFATDHMNSLGFGNAPDQDHDIPIVPTSGVSNPPSSAVVNYVALSVGLLAAAMVAWMMTGALGNKPKNRQSSLQFVPVDQSDHDDDDGDEHNFA